MRILINTLLGMLLFATLSYASAPSTPSTKCTEIDGSPSGVCTTIKFPNGAVSLSGTVASITDTSTQATFLSPISTVSISAYLAHANGTNGSTTFTDSSTTAHTLTRVGTPTISTAQSKFGGASALFSGSTDAVKTSVDSTNLNLASSDFTIDFWVRFVSITHAWVMSVDLSTNAVDSAPSIGFFTDPDDFSNDKLYLGQTTLGDFQFTSSLNDVVINTWYNVSAIRSGNTITMYLNGVAQGTINATGRAVTSDSVILGNTLHQQTNAALNGYLDEILVIPGTAIRTAAFTPVTAAYTTPIVFNPNYVTTESDPITGAINGLVKANGSGTIAAATANTDYEPALTDSSSLRATLSDESGTGAAFFAGGDIGAASGTSLAVTGNITSSNTTNIGWSVQSAANQACNTTCTNACVFGEDTAVLGQIVSCSDATADTCVCAGAN